MRTALVWWCALAAGCSFSAPDGLTGDAPIDDASPVIDDARPVIDDAPPDVRIDAPADAPPDAHVAVQRRLALTISAEQGGAETLTDFPVWVDVTHADLAASETNDSAQLYFSDANGTVLPHHLIAWDRGAGRVHAWVRAKITGGQPTTLYLYFNTVEATHPMSMPAAPFSAGFLSIWHLDQDPTATVADAKGANPGTGENLHATNLKPGKLEQGLELNGTSEAAAITNPFTGNASNSDSTFSAWVFPRARINSSFCSVIAVGNASMDHARFIHAQASSGAYAGLYGDDARTNTMLPLSQWSLVHWVYTASTHTTDFYINGTHYGPIAHTNAADTTGTPGFIGRSPDSFNQNADNHFNGVLDEVRIANVTRSAAWVGAEYRNQNAPTTFLVPAAQSQVAP